MTRHIELSGNYLASLCAQAGYGQETVDHWRTYGHRIVEVSKASVDEALRAADLDMIPRDVECHF